METKSYQIPAEYQRLQLAASKDKYRHNLLGVYFNETEVVATDGHIMAIRKKVEDNPNGCPLPENQILKFSSPKPKKRNMDLFQPVGEKLVCAETGETAELVEGQYPDYKKVVPTISEEYVSISFNADLLSQLVEAITLNKSRGGTCCTLQFNPKTPEAAILVTTDDDRSKGIIMPMGKGHR